MVVIHGEGGLILEAGGELSSDRYGLWSGRCRWKLPPGRWDLLPARLAKHPHAQWALAEKMTMRFTPGFWTLDIEYAGSPVEKTDPVYECKVGTGQEPIETHPKFASHIAGTPSSPKNGAIFIDPETGDKTTDDKIGVFDRFALTVSGGGVNEFAGMLTYLGVNNTTWIKSWTQRTEPVVEHAGKIDAPSGPQPNFPSPYNWINLGIGYVQRGGAYQCNEQWQLSGRRGWNEVVYGS